MDEMKRDSPEGWEPSQVKVEQPATTYDMFKREILKEIARCLNMPHIIAACNSSGYKYASGRLDHQTYFRSIRVEQSHIEAVVLTRRSFDLHGLYTARRSRRPGLPGVKETPHDQAHSRVLRLVEIAD